ncbi:MAG: LysR family transcriptional regulator [Sarcina sp.]
MNIKDLEYFSCLCEVKSFTKAAKELYVSQPSITLSINKLEKELGTKLINRDHSKKKLTITESGEIFRKRIKNIFNELNEAKLEIEKLNQKKITIGMPPIIGAYFFPQFIESLNLGQSIENIEFIQTGSIRMKELLSEGKVDIALIGSLEIIDEEQIESYLLKKDSFVLCLSKANKFADCKKFSFKKLKEEKFIVLGDEYLHANVLEQILATYDIKSKKIYHTGDIQTAKSLIATNLGVGIMARMSVEDMDGIKIVELDDEINFYISIAVKKGHYLTKEENFIIDIIKKQSDKL